MRHKGNESMNITFDLINCIIQSVMQQEEKL